MNSLDKAFNIWLEEQDVSMLCCYRDIEGDPGCIDVSGCRNANHVNDMECPKDCKDFIRHTDITLSSRFFARYSMYPKLFNEQYGIDIEDRVFK